ncbi:hypothetical protein LLEC1_07214 [Akanthomyces lecanii]|uniref:Tse2 ADP-ribosyltransferase toxin domain-containing protein n=1 Tax=Cordyceps confragosa TaxID=2714763 RepID=A0A179IKZ1_CORDF|nr:hypothetical protein LLEC1_07214 [Akanthomyces lecanii]
MIRSPMLTLCKAPNGVSMRPLGETQISLVETFMGDSVVVYEVPESMHLYTWGYTALPQGLVLVSEDMTVDPELGSKITDFLNQCAVRYSREQWLLIFKEGWTWSEEHQDYFRWLDDGTCEWRRSSAGESSTKPSAHKGKSSKDEKSSKGKEKASTHKERTSKDDKSSKGKDKASAQKEKSSKSSKGKEKEKGN